MAFALRWTPTARREYDRLQAAAEKVAQTRRQARKPKSSRQEGLFKQVQKTVRLLAENPRHPGLQTHAYHSLHHLFDPNGKVFEAYAQHRTPGAYRVFWCYGPARDEITIIAITPHP
jgi:mRNA-degrading endonuclease RelE of RelBE toxin-antitoxin system